jgi:hypothetical protein
VNKYGFWDFLSSFQNGIAQNIPTVSLPPGSMTVFVTAGDYVSVISHYIPIDTFMTCFSAIVVLWLIFAAISIFLQLL